MNRQNKRHTMRWPLMVLLLSSVLGSVFAEEIEKRRKVSQVEQVRFERDLEQRLTRDARAYLDHDFFIIQAAAQLEKVDSYDVKTVEVQVPLAQPPQPAPVQPPPQTVETQRKEVLSQMELETEDGINQQVIQDSLGVDTPLPGLPLSDSLFQSSREKQQRKQVEQQQRQVQPPPPAPPAPRFETREEKQETFRESRIDIKKLSLKVVLDEHVTPEQETFIRNLVIEKSNLSFIRGDELRLVRTQFPGAKALDEPEPVEEPPEEPVEEVAEEPLEEMPPPLEEPVAEEPAVPEEAPWLTWLKDNWPFLLGILAFILIFWWLSRRDKQEQEAPPAVPVEQDTAQDKLDAFISKMNFKQDTISENRLQVLREELITMAVTDRDLFTNQVTDWLNTGTPEEVAKVAGTHNLIGGSLISDLLKERVPADKLIGLAAVAHEQASEFSASDRLEVVESVYQAMTQRKLQENLTVEDNVRPFEFLEKLDDDQILFLLNDEAQTVKALVFSQLPSDRAAALMKRVREEERGRLAMEISRFAQLPVKAFRDIANRLAKKAVDVPSFANISMDGVDLLIGMLDHMDSSEETALLSNIKGNNPDLYYKIKQSYISFNDIVRMPKLALKNLIREIDREQLAMALYDMDDVFKGAVLAAMLERPRAMLQSVINNLNAPDEATINDAKRTVARRARAMLKSGEFSMPQEQKEQAAPSAEKQKKAS